MSAHDPAEAVEVLDLLLKFFGDGERWVKGRLSDRRGNRCLVGALDFVSGCHAIQSDAAERYLADEISPAAACNDAVGDCARFRASLRRIAVGIPITGHPPHRTGRAAFPHPAPTLDV
jgi:hypothetical protein